jgi:ankyrin repeat protein
LFLIERGATVDVHTAAHLGMLERLKELVSANPELVHARGSDGQTPLHFAPTIETARYLLDHGAEINARDVITNQHRRNTWYATARKWRATSSRADAELTF